MCGCKKFLREPVNAISHGAGALGAMAALTLMIVCAALHADVWHVVSFSVFGGTLILMYASSCLYHALKISDQALMVFRRIDHIMIFMVIAGSYTPLCLVPLRGAWGWSLLGAVWGIAVAGIFIKIFFMGTPRWISTVIYLVMGWLCVIAVYPLVKTLESGALMWLAAGGLFYSIGAVIYALKRPNPFPRILGFHEIWHCFVILGSASHFWLSFKYLMYI
ncbi:PAQR family membrane homeostasis protein TrhA [Desulfobacter vibrioformis]|uniref:PAQR family membrane homeostasis protein TrhA n=1 Tax=Desulfobacter vibrioformis TaxID=34031 RepID=UPI0005578A2A|nr:hemolysin III family protein [Desulfobacter vibrioformis]